MRFKKNQSGVTLPEMTVVITIAALILALTIPAVNMLMNSFESESGAKSMINAALASARSMAIKNHQYVGIRFQKRYNFNDSDSLKWSQYIIFIIKGENRLVTNNLDIDGFHAVDGVTPIKLPDSIGVTDLIIRTNWTNPASGAIGRKQISLNTDIDTSAEVNDITSFSIIFSPAGKLVTHPVRVRNRDGETAGTETATRSSDDIINTISKVTNPDNPIGMFLQDDYADFGYGSEMSRNCFYIYDSKIFKQEYKKGAAWTGYLQRISQKPVFINPYTGTIVDEK